jgi:hypothetical protein
MEAWKKQRGKNQKERSRNQPEDPVTARAEPIANRVLVILSSEVKGLFFCHF